MNAEQKFEHVQDFFNEASDTFRRGVGTLNTWSEQAKELIEKKPGAILAAVGFSGFITGSLLRHGLTTRRSSSAHAESLSNTLPGFNQQKLPADPFILFVAGIAAGVVAGPKLIQEAISRIENYRDSSDSSENIIDMEGTRHRSHGSGHSPMDERPFEKV